MVRRVPGPQRTAIYQLSAAPLGSWDSSDWPADLTGRVSETHRHFFFSLIGAGAGAALGVCYLSWFLSTGLGPRRAVFWSLTGVFCTPSWFYSTSTFDDILGAVAVTGGLVVALMGRRLPTWSGPVLAGAFVAFAVNCKPPLALFAVPIAAALDDFSLARSSRLARAGTVALGLVAGVSLYLAYDAYKFPPGTKELHASLLRQYISPWPGNIAVGLLCLTFSPAAGLPFYAPTTVLGLVGLKDTAARLRWTLSISIALFVTFIASMSFFKGDPAWGPRYLTPVCALLWLFAPAGASRWRPMTSASILFGGLVIQLLALSVDPHRLYIERRLPSAFGAVAPVLYFDVRNAHLLNRPREIVEVWRARHENGEMFSPVSPSTFAFPIIDRTESGPEAVRKYQILNSFRPWWISQTYLPPAERPVSIAWAVPTLASLAAVGALLLGLALWPPIGAAEVALVRSNARSRGQSGS